MTLQGKTPQQAALQHLCRIRPSPRAEVGYRSAGSVLLIGPAADTARCLELLACYEQLTVTQVICGANHAEVAELTGYLGNFLLNPAAGAARSGQRNRFDLVLDLTDPPLLRQTLRPIGYFAPARADDAVTAAIQQLSELVGEFDKVKYYHHEPGICAHSTSKLDGCRNCIDACPAAAISSKDFQLAIDPHLCQGCGTCATVCPSGAMIYNYPTPAETLEQLRAALRAYFDAGGRNPVILFHQARDNSRIEQLAQSSPDTLPYPIEEVSAIGHEVWLAALAYGASAVILLFGQDAPDAIDKQIVLAQTILQGMGFDTARIQALTEAAWRNTKMPEHSLGIPRANFSGLDDKRSVARLAIEHLLAHAREQPQATALPAGAPYGRLDIDKARCTLCLACVSVCPVRALSDGGDRPQLFFQESNCVQCGLCATACPEHAIALQPRLVYDRADWLKPQLLNEEAIFRCTRCGKPFATQKMIDRITAKLSDHPMFRDGQLKLLSMCEECRVKVMLGQTDHAGQQPAGAGKRDR